jgi:cytidylate kinase
VTNINVIAVDGPAASGKSTISQQLAARLGFLFLDTGSMYRAVTLAVLQQGVDVLDETAVTQLAQQMNMEMQAENGEDDGRHYTVLLDGQDVTWAIRTPAVEANVSQVSSYLGVRQEMVRRQREVGKRGRVVMVGRDIGTVVMPEAPLKLYVIATAEERARRRWQDRQQQGFHDDYNTILADVERRDLIDSNRQHSPLRPAADALIIDTTDRPVGEIVAEIVQLIGNR